MVDPDNTLFPVEAEKPLKKPPAIALSIILQMNSIGDSGSSCLEPFERAKKPQGLPITMTDD